MKKIFFILLIIHTISCNAQIDFKKEIIGNWEQEYLNSDGEVYFIGEIWTFNNDNTCNVKYSSDSNGQTGTYTYEITEINCAGNTLYQGKFYLKMQGIVGSTFDDSCYIIDIYNQNRDSNSINKKMTLYNYGALGANVFIKK